MNGNEDFLFKFKTKKYFIAENGKKRRIKKKRKFKSDDIRKKIKSRFHKTFKNIINENLKKAGSKKLFDFFPQCFIGNVSKKLNSACLDLTYKELLLKDFISKFEIALKECNESEYWLELLYETNSLSKDDFERFKKRCARINGLE